MILYFLSRFSVKIKVAFLIIFLISGVLFWNISYLNDTIERNENTQKVLSAFNTAERLNKMLFSLQNERAFSIAYAEHGKDKSSLDKVRQETDGYLKTFSSCRKNLEAIPSKKINAKITLLISEIDTLAKIRTQIDEAKIEGDEIIRYYTDSLIKHFIDLIALMTARIESNDFNAYFNLISAIEYTSLKQALVQVAVGREEVFDQLWYDLITTQDAKAQTYLDRFKTFAEPEVVKSYYKLYSTLSFIYLNQMLEELKSQVGHKVSGIDIDVWLNYYNTYMADVKKVETLNTMAVQKKIEAVIIKDNAEFDKNMVLLLLPLFFVFLVAFFIFIDIRKSLNTLLNFLKEKGSNERDQVLLSQSKSEFGTIYRTLFDFNNKVKDQIKIIEHNYETDPLTSIPNRNRLLKEMKGLQKQGHNFTVIYIDIHNFSHINDSFGQKIGDLYLQETSQILQEIAGSISSDKLLETDVFRMGSDEFVIVCSHAEYINLLITKLKEVYIIEHDDIDMPLSFTFGIANSDTKHSQASILSRAEIASRYAIRMHKRYAYYDEDALLEKRHKANLEWVKKIANAFKDGLFAVHFQPIADTHSGKTVKYEVLIRMYDKEKAIMISPAEFLGVLQQSGHEKELTKLIIDQSFQSYEKCKIDLSVNMTREDLDDDMVDYLIAKAKTHKIPPEAIVIELVESEELLKGNYITIISQIKHAGFKIAIDDFGTGYSNFAYLTQIKPNFIKIDGSLIEHIDASIEQRQVVEGIYNFAHKLGIEVIAEFITNEKLLQVAKEIGIEYVQGYHIGEVMSCEKIRELQGIQ
ncbi:EAL domain-containing protein [Campylobacterota bacterium]